MVKVLELFAGSRSIGKAAESLGYKVYSSDLNEFEGIDYPIDILDFDTNKIPFKPDIIWASPPCTYFSVASIGKHWNKDHTPKKEQSLLIYGQIILDQYLTLMVGNQDLNVLTETKTATTNQHQEAVGQEHKD